MARCYEIWPPFAQGTPGSRTSLSQVLGILRSMTEPSTNQMLQIHEHEAEGMVEFFFDLADQIRSPSGRQGALFLDLIANEIQTRLDDGGAARRVSRSSDSTSSS